MSIEYGDSKYRENFNEKRRGSQGRSESSKAYRKNSISQNKWEEGRKWSHREVKGSKEKMRHRKDYDKRERNEEYCRNRNNYNRKEYDNEYRKGRSGRSQEERNYEGKRRSIRESEKGYGTKERYKEKSDSNTTHRYRNESMNPRHKGRRYEDGKEDKDIYRSSEEKVKSYGGFDDKYYKNRKRKLNAHESLEDLWNEGESKKNSISDILEKKNHIELSRYIFIYKISNDVTEEEIDELMRNIAIENAFSLPINISMHNFSHFAIKDDLFVKENLEFLKNNTYFNSIQQNLFYKYGEEVNDDLCCLVEFPSEDACGRLYSLFEKDGMIHIKNSLAYVFPIFKLLNKKVRTEDKQSTKKSNDWYCSFCNFLNFSKRSVCYFCKQVKTADTRIVEIDSSRGNTSEQVSYANRNMITNHTNVYGSFPMDTIDPIYVSNTDPLLKGGQGRNSLNILTKHGGIEDPNASYVTTNDCTAYSFHDNSKMISSTVEGTIENEMEQFDSFRTQLLNDEKTNFLIIKDLDGRVSDKEIMKFLNTILEKRNVECMYLFNDIKGSYKRRGFCFIQFISPYAAEKKMKELEGNYYINFHNTFLKIDYVNEKEKEAFFNCIHLAKLNIHPSSYIVSKHHIPYFNFFVNYFEFIVNVNLLYYSFFLIWTSQMILFKTGKPPLEEFIFDYTSQYYYHPTYQIYFDSVSNFYMSLSNGYFIWNDKMNALVRVFQDELQRQPQPQPQSQIQTQTQSLTSEKEPAYVEPYSHNTEGTTIEVNNKLLENTTDMMEKTLFTNVKNNINETTGVVPSNKISVFVEKAKQIALTSKKNQEQMNTNETEEMNQEEKKKNISKTVIEKHFAVESADEENDSEEEIKKDKKEEIKKEKEKKEEIKKEEDDDDDDEVEMEIEENEEERYRQNKQVNANSSISKNDHDSNKSRYGKEEPLKGQNSYGNQIKNSKKEMVEGSNNQRNSSRNGWDHSNDDSMNKKEALENATNINEDMNTICFVCLRKFISEDMLQRHVNYSELHKRNLQFV